MRKQSNSPKECCRKRFEAPKSIGIKVSVKNLFFNKNWEDKKIQEFMNIEKKSGWE